MCGENTNELDWPQIHALYRLTLPKDGPWLGAAGRSAARQLGTCDPLQLGDAGAIGRPAVYGG